MIKCKNCGAEAEDGSRFCPECGKPLDLEGEAKKLESPLGTEADAQHCDKKAAGALADGIIGVVSGVLAIAFNGFSGLNFFLFLLAFLCFAFGLAISSGVLKGSRRNGIATAAFVLSAVTLGLCVIAAIVFLALNFGRPY